MYKIKEIATDFGITLQAIYNRKEDLIKQSYMKRSAGNDCEITNDGYEFKKEKKRRVKITGIINKKIDYIYFIKML